MYDEQRERRKTRALLGVAVVACALLGAALIPSPYAIEGPGPVVNTLGEVQLEDGPERVISIVGRDTYQPTGELNLLTVSIYGTPDDPRSWLSLVPALLNPAQRIAPLTEFYPEGVTAEDREAANAVQMDASQQQAAAAAFRYLDEPVETELVVGAVSEDGPAADLLRVGDRITSVNGVSVADYSALRAAIVAGSVDVNTELTIGFERDGAAETVAMTPVIPEGSSDPVIGVALQIAYTLPAEVDFTLSRIGGPSAGMIFALGVIDELTPEDILNGLTVSGTGTVTDAGAVGGIGGLEQKMWGAADAQSDLFLMPVENCADIPARVPGDLTIAPVNSLAEAVDAIRAVAAGEQPAGIERCG